MRDLVALLTDKSIDTHTHTHTHTSFSAMEAAVILSNLARHSSYIKATTSYLLAHVRTDADMIGPHLLSDDIEKLNSDLSGAVTAVSSLHDEVLSLEIEVQRVGA